MSTVAEAAVPGRAADWHWIPRAILFGLLAFVIIRIDLALTGSTAAGSGRRAAREADEASAVRPEPGRTHALL